MNKGKGFSRTRSLLWGGCSVVLLTLLDQCTKLLAYEHLRQKPSVSLIPGVFELHYLYPENRGIAFGMFQGKAVLFAALTVLVMLLLIWAYMRTPCETHYVPLMLTMTLMFSGALGNFIDRVFRGYVIDFLYFSLINFPVFNVADIFVVVSGGLMVILICTLYRDDDFSFYSLKRKER